MTTSTVVPTESVLTLHVTNEHRASGEARMLHARPGQALTFHGCLWGCCPLPDLRVTGAAGSIVADHHRWELTNDSASTPLRVWNLDSPHDQVRVPPGGTIAPPFDLAGVAGAAGQLFTVFGPEPDRLRPISCVSAVPVAWGIDPDSRRHDVMVALVAPRMQADPRAPLPTTCDIGRRLGISARTVQEHLAALARTLGLEGDGTRRPGRLQEALATYALNHPYVPPRGRQMPW